MNLLWALLLGVICLSAVSVILRTAGFRGFFQSAFGGLCGLGAVSLTSMFGAVLWTPNLFTGCVSVLLGLPGVIGMLFLRLILVAA